MDKLKTKKCVTPFIRKPLKEETQCKKAVCYWRKSCMLLAEKLYVTGGKAVCYWRKKFFKVSIYGALRGVKIFSTISTISTIRSSSPN